ncbi:hypothetical protein FFF34_002810 [Inquilinus sp. KBS0705]|nr:hypothetical protein FFF34_002810 [Inquilinus sp. KBS0705]
MILTTTTFDLSRADGSKLYIAIEPVYYDDEGQSRHAAVYRLRATRREDIAGESSADNPGNTTEIGTFAHKEGDPHEWAYIGDFLTEDEQDQVAMHIQSHGAGLTAEQNDSFYVQAYSNGGMNSFEVTTVGRNFTVYYDGRIIAELQRDDEWQQVSGQPLADDVFVSIKQAIDAKFYSGGQ